MNETHAQNQGRKKQQGKAVSVLNDIKLIEEEIKFLSDYCDEFYEMSFNVVQDYMNEVNRNTELGHDEARIFELQHYMSLTNPEITLICEQYSQFCQIKEHYNGIKNDIKQLEKKSSDLKHRHEIVRTHIEENDSYFSQFKELYEEHIENWKLLADVSATERKYGHWGLFTSVMEMYLDKVKLILTPRLFVMLEKMEKNLITIEELRYSQEYKEIKDFIAEVRLNKEYLMMEVTKNLRLHFPELNKRKTEKLKAVHKVYINNVNNLFEKKYRNIPIKEDIQSLFVYLEDAIRSLKLECDDLKKS